MMMMVMMMMIYGDARFVSVHMNKLFHRIPLPDSNKLRIKKYPDMCVSNNYH